MDRAELQAAQRPLKDRYREEPESALLTLRAHGELDEQQIACSVATGRAIVEAGLHPATGGTGALACSGDMLLEALVACSGVTLRSVATSMELDVSGSVQAEGDLDFRGTLGVDRRRPSASPRSGSASSSTPTNPKRSSSRNCSSSPSATASSARPLPAACRSNGATPPRRPSGSRRRNRSRGGNGPCGSPPARSRRPRRA